MKTHAAFVLKDEDGNLLFVKRSESKSTLPGAWSFPSGTKEEEETIEETAVREAKEELDLTVTFEHIAGKTDLESFGVELHFVVCSVSNEEKETLTIMDYEEIADVQWMKLEEFFRTYQDDTIGHGLVWLRTHPEIASKLTS
ncbi:MAG: NUDIX hydrolase [Patescibacteria group bacterium]